MDMIKYKTLKKPSIQYIDNNIYIEALTFCIDILNMIYPIDISVKYNKKNFPKNCNKKGANNKILSSIEIKYLLL